MPQECIYCLQRLLVNVVQGASTVTCRPPLQFQPAFSVLPVAPCQSALAYDFPL